MYVRAGADAPQAVVLFFYILLHHGEDSDWHLFGALHDELVRLVCEDSLPSLCTAHRYRAIPTRRSR